MASRILFNNGLEIDQAISGAYSNIIIRGSGFVRDTGVQNISGAKFFYDTITFYSGLNVTGDFVPSGDIAGNLMPKTNNLYDLGSAAKQWGNGYFDGIIRVDNLHVDESAFITGGLNVLGTTTLSGDFVPTNVAAHYLPKTDNVYDLGSSSQEFRDLWIDGTGRVDSLHVDENASVSGNLSVTGTLTVGGSTTLNQLSASSFSSTGTVSSTNSGIFNAMFITGTGIPSSATAAGVYGQLIVGSGYLYACTGTNRWGRTHLTGWS